MGGRTSRHHMLWPRRDYHGHHEKELRRLLVVDTEWEQHSDLHARMQPPVHPDKGITLTLLDHFHQQDELTEIAPLYAIDRLIKLGSMEALALSDHLVRQLGHLGVGYGQTEPVQTA